MYRRISGDVSQEPSPRSHPRRDRHVPAIVVLGFWIVIQLLNGVGSMATTSETGGGVAFMAHIGGFVAGLVLVKLMASRQRPALA